MQLRAKSIGRTLAGFALVVSAVPLLAADVDIVKARIAGYREIGAAFKAINDQLRSGTPQPYLMQVSAREIANGTREQYRWFPAGSGPRPGVKTRAKAAIWAQPAKFKALQDNLAAKAGALALATRGADTARIQAAVRELGAACKACHTVYREEEE
jgi:cytochrome c556